MIPGATHSIRPQYDLAFDGSLERRCLLRSYIVHIPYVRYPDLHLEDCLRISYSTDRSKLHCILEEEEGGEGEEGEGEGGEEGEEEGEGE